MIIFALVEKAREVASVFWSTSLTWPSRLHCYPVENRIHNDAFPSMTLFLAASSGCSSCSNPSPSPFPYKTHISYLPLLKKYSALILITRGAQCRTVFVKKVIHMYIVNAESKTTIFVPHLFLKYSLWFGVHYFKYDTIKAKRYLSPKILHCWHSPITPILMRYSSSRKGCKESCRTLAGVRCTRI